MDYHYGLSLWTHCGFSYGFELWILIMDHHYGFSLWIIIMDYGF